MSLLRQGKAQALTIYLGESDQWQGQPLYVTIIHLLREHGCAGATATRAVLGYGAGVRLHEQRSWQWSSDASIVIQVIDQPARLRRLLPQLQEMLSSGLMTLQEIEVLKYTHAHTRGLPTKLPVRQVMEISMTTVQPETPIATVLDLLLAAPFRALPVIDDQKRLLGIISTGDLMRAEVLPVRRGVVRAALALDEVTAEAVGTPLGQARQRDLTARDVMNQNVCTVKPDTPIREAARLMVETGLRRLPVVESDGVVAGIVTRADLLQVIVISPLMSPLASSATQPLGQSRPLANISPQQQPVSAYMTPDVATVCEQAPITEIIDSLILSPLKHVIVVDAQQQVKGIISDVDVLARMQADARPGLLSLLTRWAQGTPARLSTGSLRATGGKARVAADIMNREVVTVTETTSVQETIARMMGTGRKVVPVVDARNQLKGVVGRSDLLHVLLEN